MFGNQIRLFRLAGFEVKVDISWIIIAILVIWSLAAGIFPAQFRGLSRSTYIAMGVAGMIGLFSSIVLHEFSHSLVARRQGMQMKGITLFIFGGVAEMGEEPPSPRAEFLMSVAGPVTSFALGAIFYALATVGLRGGWPVPSYGVLSYLAYINWALGVFNLIPAFPLDGGRILRSILWRARRDLEWATHVSARIGSGFGMVLVFVGVVSFVSGHFVGGAWWFLIGMFVRNAASMSYQQVVTRRILQGESIGSFMKPDPVSVPETTSVEDFVNDYVYRYHYQLFPVVKFKGSSTLVDAYRPGRSRRFPVRPGRQPRSARSLRTAKRPTPSPRVRRPPRRSSTCGRPVRAGFCWPRTAIWSGSSP